MIAVCGYLNHSVVEVARVGVELGELVLRRLDDLGMAVPDMRHVVDAVQVGPAALIVHVLTARLSGVHCISAVACDQNS